MVAIVASASSAPNTLPLYAKPGREGWGWEAGAGRQGGAGRACGEAQARRPEAAGAPSCPPTPRTGIVHKHVDPAVQLRARPVGKGLDGRRIRDVQLVVLQPLARLTRQLLAELGQRGPPPLLAAGGQHRARATVLRNFAHDFVADALVGARHHAVLDLGHGCVMGGAGRGVDWKGGWRG